MAFEWHTPAHALPLEQVDRVELLELPERDIITPEGWPDTFWPHVGARVALAGEAARAVVELYRELELDEPARCHMPAWGIAFTAGDALLFTVTLCFGCSNAYVYTSFGKDLRAFDPSTDVAKALRGLLQEQLPARKRSALMPDE